MIGDAHHGIANMTKSATEISKEKYEQDHVESGAGEVIICP